MVWHLHIHLQLTKTWGSRSSVFGQILGKTSGGYLGHLKAVFIYVPYSEPVMVTVVLSNFLKICRLSKKMSLDTVVCMYVVVGDQQN